MIEKRLSDFTLADYSTELSARYEYIESLKKEAESVVATMVGFCPIKLGDRVIATGPYSGRTIQVNKIEVVMDSKNVPISFMVRGAVVRKDGSVGVTKSYTVVRFDSL